eukprot:gene21907-28949_t
MIGPSPQDHPPMWHDLLTTLTRLSAQCMGCQHKGASATALTCMSALTGLASSSLEAAARSAASLASKLGVPNSPQQASKEVHIVMCILEQGPVVMSGVIGCLISASPLPRLQKLATILTQMCALAGSNIAAERIGPSLHNKSPNMMHQMPSLSHYLLTSWLSVGLAAHNLQAWESHPAIQALPCAVHAAAHSDGLSSRARATSLVKLKKALRNVVEVHSKAHSAGLSSRARATSLLKLKV